MGKRELVFAAFDNQLTERVPVGFWYHFAPDQLFDNSPATIEKNITGHQEFFDGFQPDFIKLMSDGYFTYPHPEIKNIKTAKDLKNIKATGAREWIEQQVTLVKELTGRFGNEVATFYNIFAPATYLKFQLELNGVSFGALVDENPTAVLAALNEIAQDIAALAKAVIEEGGADGIYFSVQNIQDAHLTKADYLIYIAPSERKVLTAANAAGLYNILHICGYEGAKNDLSVYIDYPAKVINWAVVVEGVSLETGKTLFNGRAVIGGFANTKTDLLYHGSQAEITEYTRNLLDHAGTTGIIIGADCTIPEDTSFEHLNWVREAAKDYSAK